MKNHLTRLLAASALLLAAACSGPLISDPAAAPRELPTAGVHQENLAATPRKAPVSAGEPLPHLLLEDQNGTLVSTGEVIAAGDALLLFHQGDGAPETRALYEWVRANRTMAASRHCEILLITPDPVEHNLRVAAREDLHVAILHDPSGWAARVFGLLPSGGSTRVARTWSIVAGREGRIFEVRQGLFELTDLITVLASRPDPRPYRALELPLLK